MPNLELLLFLSFLKRFLPDVPRRCLGWGRGGVGMCGVGVGGGVGVVIFCCVHPSQPYLDRDTVPFKSSFSCTDFLSSAKVTA